jgi:DnaJ-class molecular chaperone
MRTEQCPDCQGNGLFKGQEVSEFSNFSLLPYCFTCSGTGAIEIIEDDDQG